MGLDVYLYRYEDREDIIRKEDEHEKLSEKNWEEVGEYSTLTDEVKDAIRKKNKDLAISMGLNEDGTDPRKSRVEENSSIDKEHYFKLGYFRSSYNGGGINRVLQNLEVPGLYDIFEAGDEYIFQPNWDDALVKVDKSIDLLQQKGDYRCFAVAQNMFSSGEGLPTSEKEALDIFLKQLSSPSAFECYSSSEGYFSPKEPMKIFAIIPGKQSVLGERPCSYIVSEGENAWYLTALRIVKETIEWVLSQPDKEKYYLHWSG